MKRVMLGVVLLAVGGLGVGAGWGASTVAVVDFSKGVAKEVKGFASNKRETPTVSASSEQTFEGKQVLKLHYHFLGDKGTVGVDIPVNIFAPVQKLRFQMYGDGSGCTYSVSLKDASGKKGQLQLPPPDQAGGGIGKAMADNGGQAHALGDPNAMKVDFTGWKEIVLDVGAQGAAKPDKEKFDFPFYSQATIEIHNPGKETSGDLYISGLSVDTDANAAAVTSCFVHVTSPEYGGDVKGETTVKVSGPSYKELTVKCWKQGEGFGADSVVATVKLDEKGDGSFVFPADQYPHGPIIVRIIGDNGDVRDKCNLQLFNKGGVSWNEGLPKDPPAAAGMKLVFADDFSGPMSISAKDPKATYYSHKAPNGTQDFSHHTFSDAESPKNPFKQDDGYLRIRASDKLHSSGLISSIKNDGSGITAKAPCYFECRLISQSAVGAWPAFWLMTDYQLPRATKGSDELDIIEGYGGNGPGHPNFDSGFMITPHRWEQGQEGKVEETKAFKAMQNPYHFKRAGIPSSWCETFHVFGCKVTETDTIYYLDNIEVARHPTFPYSKVEPIFFFINLATGGGWPVDISRYGVADMYVDYVRVYQGERAAVPGPVPGTEPAK